MPLTIPAPTLGARADAEERTALEAISSIEANESVVVYIVSVIEQMFWI